MFVVHIVVDQAFFATAQRDYLLASYPLTLSRERLLRMTTFMQEEIDLDGVPRSHLFHLVSYIACVIFSCLCLCAIFICLISSIR